MDKIEIYADGSSTGRADREFGYGWIICLNEDIRFAGYGGGSSGTNNLAELQGAIEGFKALEASGIYVAQAVVLISDSDYTLGIGDGRYVPSKNLELAQELRQFMRKYQAATRHVRGHALRNDKPWRDHPRDVLLNEKCDHLAKLGKDKYTPAHVLAKKAKKKRVQK